MSGSAHGSNSGAPAPGSLRTHFASAARLPTGEAQEQADRIRWNPIVQEVLGVLPHPVMILNEHRQLILASKAVVDLTQRHKDELVGMRPGEALGCVNSSHGPGGCGTSEACRHCGIVHAVLAALHGSDTAEDARLTLEDGRSLDLVADAHPIQVGDESMVVVSLEDVADTRRRRALERTFFHDVLNTAGGVRGLINLLEKADESDRTSLFRMLADASDRLLGEIQSQRLLLTAESAEYKLHVTASAVSEIMESAVAPLRSLATREDVQIHVVVEDDSLQVATDITLLIRVLVNLARNAIEASGKGMKVTLEARRDGDRLVFTTHNETTMSRKVELQLFQRSFSTKGSDRGLGTYSVKLFTEDYLQGSVSFTTSEAEGTTFTIEIPDLAAEARDGDD